MSRTYVVTGSASGIGRATSDLLTREGHHVIGVDRADADVCADLGTAEGRAQLVTDVAARCRGTVDGVLAVAGLAAPTPATVAVNYFGAVATLNGLRPLLASSSAPRAVAVSSMAAIFPADDELLAACTAGDEARALGRASTLATDPEMQGSIYGTAKRALSQWIRRTAPSDEWAGASIALNAVAPGVVRTPMTTDLLATEEGRERLAQMVPMPLNGFFEPQDVAELLAWLASEKNSHLCGQVIYIDGGSDAVLRGDSVW